MRSKVKSLKVVELEDRLYDLASVLRHSKSKNNRTLDIKKKINTTKRELEKLDWGGPEDFEAEFENELRPEDFIGMV